MELKDTENLVHTVPVRASVRRSLAGLRAVSNDDPAMESPSSPVRFLSYFQIFVHLLQILLTSNAKQSELPPRLSAKNAKSLILKAINEAPSEAAPRAPPDELSSASALVQRLIKETARRGTAVVTRKDVRALSNALKRPRSSSAASTSISRPQSSSVVSADVFVNSSEYDDDVLEYLVDNYFPKTQNRKKQRAESPIVVAENDERVEEEAEEEGRVKRLTQNFEIDRTLRLTQSQAALHRDRDVKRTNVLHKNRSERSLLSTVSSSHASAHTPTSKAQSDPHQFDDSQDLLFDDFDDDAASFDDPVLEVATTRTRRGVSLDETEFIASILFDLDGWEFDLFALHDCLDGFGTLKLVGFALFERHGLLKSFSISERTMLGYLESLQRAYVNRNPYHNALHAADVAQSLSHLLVKCGVDKLVSELDRFAALFAALAHDVGHPGLSNAYLVETGDRLAVVYNDSAPLENFHASTAFALCESHDVLEGLTDKRERALFRRRVIEMILATDNAKHDDVVKSLRDLPKKDDYGIAVGSPLLAAPSSERSDIESATAQVSLTEHQKSCLLNVCLHAADLSGSAKTWKTCEIWAHKITAEFHLQGDLERSKGMSVLPIMDRTSEVPMGKFQIGFIRGASRDAVVVVHLKVGLILTRTRRRRSTVVRTTSPSIWRSLRRVSSSSRNKSTPLGRILKSDPSRDGERRLNNT